MKKILALAPCIFLAACKTPEVVVHHNEFRKESTCTLTNNAFSGNGNEVIEFTLMESTLDYGPFNDLLPAGISVTTSYGAGLKEDSIVVFVADGQSIETQSVKGSKDSSSSLIHSPGYFSQGVYIPGYSYTVHTSQDIIIFLLEKKDIKTLANAKNVKLKIETLDGKITAEIPEQNRKALGEFKAKCLDANFGNMQNKQKK